MFFNRNLFVFFLYFLVGIAGTYAQNTDLFGYTKVDTSLSGVIYYQNNKSNHLITDIFNVNYDEFMTHYYNKANIPDGHYYLQLNNEGSAIKDMIFYVDDISDYKRKPNTFKPYIFTPQNVKYFQNKKAYTSLSYSNATNGNQFFEVNFAKNVYKGLNLQLDYFVNYADQTFINSQIMNQFFNTTLNYISSNGRYRLNAAFVHNRAYIQENGGIAHDSVFINQEYSKPSSYPVASTQGWSKWKTSEYVLSQTYRLNSDTSVSPQILNAGALVHNISFGRYADLYDDENKTIKDSLGTNIWRNSVFWTNDVFTKRASFFVPFTIGVNYDVINFTDSLNNKTYHVVSPEFKTGIRTDFIDILANGVFTMSGDDYQGDYQLKISAEKHLNIMNQSVVFADIQLQHKQPDYIFKHYLNETLSWNNDVNKTNTQTLSIGINVMHKFFVKANYISLTDFYFLDQSLQINNGDGKLYQLQTGNNFSIGKWQFRGCWTLQKSQNEDIIHIPLLAIKQGISYKFALFKGKLVSHVGMDINWFSKYKADVYNPLLGIYCYQSEEKIGNYLFANAYININIDRFCMFAMIQHPYAGMVNHSYFNSPLYPADGFVFRYGFIWKLLD